MKSLLAILMLLMFGGNICFAQIENPVQWEFTSKKISEKVYELYATATIENKWHVYSQQAGEGPEPTSLKFSVNPLVVLNGKVREEGKMEKVYDPNFKSTLQFYSNKVSFVQKIKLKSAVATVVKGSLTYMVCNDKKCLPPKEIPFSIKVSSK